MTWWNFWLMKNQRRRLGWCFFNPTFNNVRWKVEEFPREFKHLNGFVIVNAAKLVDNVIAIMVGCQRLKITLYQAGGVSPNRPKFRRVLGKSYQPLFHANLP